MEIRENDYGKTITFTVYESNGTTIRDLSDIDSILFLVRDNNTGRNIVEGNCVITDEENGECTYEISSADFKKDGCFDAGLQLVIDSPASKETSENFSLIITDSLK